MSKGLRKFLSVALTMVLVITGAYFVPQVADAGTSAAPFGDGDAYSLIFNVNTSITNYAVGKGYYWMYYGESMTLASVNKGSTAYAVPSQVTVSYQVLKDSVATTSGTTSYTVAAGDTSSDGYIHIRYTIYQTSGTDIFSGKTCLKDITIKPIDFVVARNDSNVYSSVGGTTLHTYDGFNDTFEVLENGSYTYWWSSSDTHVCQIAASGNTCLITYLKAGGSTITVTSSSGKTAKFNIYAHDYTGSYEEEEDPDKASKYQTTNVTSTGDVERIYKSLNGTGTTVKGSISYTYPEAMLYDTKLSTDSATYTKAVNAVNSSLSKTAVEAVYDISLMNQAGGYYHEHKGMLTVNLPRPSGISVGSGQSIVVYRLADDGSLVKCDTAYSDSVITFTTNHFSTFIITLTNATPTSAGTTTASGSTTTTGTGYTLSPKTGEE